MRQLPPAKPVASVAMAMQHNYHRCDDTNILLQTLFGEEQTESATAASVSGCFESLIESPPPSRSSRDETSKTPASLQSPGACSLHQWLPSRRSVKKLPPSVYTRRAPLSAGHRRSGVSINMCNSL